jgi:hypothetical protein
MMVEIKSRTESEPRRGDIKPRKRKESYHYYQPMNRTGKESQ